MGSNDASDVDKNIRDPSQSCPVFGIKSGGPLIGPGILLILFAFIPFFSTQSPVPAIIPTLFAGFGIFLIWAGITK